MTESTETSPEWEIDWDDIGRELLREVLRDRRIELEDALRDAEEALCADGELTQEHVSDIRVALGRATFQIENRAAPLVGLEPWKHPANHIPNSVMWELTDHPKAEGIDPREYVRVDDGEE